MFNKKEIIALIISIFVLTLAVAFDDGSPVFQWSTWLGNFCLVFFIVGISFIAQQMGHKIAASLDGFKAEYDLWGVQTFKLKDFWVLNPSRYMNLMGRAKNKPFPRKISIFNKEFLIESFPLGLVLSLLVTIFSNGQLFFLAVGQYNLLIERHSRFGRKFLEVTHFEEAKIALAGPMVNIVLMVIAALFNQKGIFDTFILVNAWLALFHMLPLPKLAGTKILFGSRVLYAFSFTFMIAMVILVYTVGVIPLLLISLLCGAIFASIAYYFWYLELPKKS
jgi:Zn-dependent protease